MNHVKYVIQNIFYREIDFKREGTKVKKLIILLLIVITCSIPGDNIHPHVTGLINPSLDCIILENPQGVKNKIFPKVAFTHKIHYVDYEINCRTCHHNWKTKEKDNPQKCIECHKPNLDNTNKKFILLRNAYHRCCKNCHAELKAMGKSAGPDKCRGCHVIRKDKEEVKLEEG